MISIPMKTVAMTTRIFPRKRTNAPTELMAATLSMLAARRVKALRAAVQKL